jgi:hypothetical protein
MPNDGKSSIKPFTLLNKNARIVFIERIPSLALLLFFHIFSSKLSSSGTCHNLSYKETSNEFV